MAAWYIVCDVQYDTDIIYNMKCIYIMCSGQNICSSICNSVTLFAMFFYDQYTGLRAMSHDVYFGRKCLVSLLILLLQVMTHTT